jgi:hypothetical protein
MPLSVLDLYQKVLPKTNCKDCGFPTCLAFASMVVSEKLPLKKCPHLAPDVVEEFQPELDDQHAIGKWTKKDMAQESLEWARERAASMRIEDLAERIGGTLIKDGDTPILELPYFSDAVLIKEGSISKRDGSELNRWEQVFIYNHMAQGGSTAPGENWKGLEQFPNTISKIKSMREHVEIPLVKRFKGKSDELRKAARPLGGAEIKDQNLSADVVLLFRPLPRVPVLLLFWDEEEGEAFDAQVKLLFDETITEHLDLESIIFLGERVAELLCAQDG